MRISPAPARRVTTNIAWTCTTDRGSRGFRRGAAGVGLAGAARPLVACRPDRLQLVVGPQPSHRRAYLVGLRDPYTADLPLAVGLRRQLDGALVELRPRPPRSRRVSPRALDG